MRCPAGATGMTQIDFYTRVDDKLYTACRLAGKAFMRGMRVMIYCVDAGTAQRVNRLLWTTPPTGFLPHCTAGDRLAGVTPVVVASGTDEPPHDEVLLNLGVTWPPFFSRFRRLVEIVSREEDDCRTARDRYRFYRDRGYEIRTHDLSRTAA
jgi:DNA polymerase-3 subunit chi